MNFFVKVGGVGGGSYTTFTKKIQKYLRMMGRYTEVRFMYDHDGTKKKKWKNHLYNGVAFWLNYVFLIILTITLWNGEQKYVGEGQSICFINLFAEDK